SNLEPKLVAAITYLAVFTTLVTFLLTQAAIVVIGPTRTMAYNYLNPSLVALLVWILGEESVGWYSLPGIALTLISMVVFQQSDPVEMSAGSSEASKKTQFD
ncbi:MAG: EamA family transporter, partial [Planctomycetota bacterium]|nr:EamA family transporter [Planctomycetota bacterium]